jgi:tetratricopeptide (TPR) repeat protein
MKPVKLAVFSLVGVGLFAVTVLAIRAFSNRADDMVRPSWAFETANQPASPADRQIRAAQGAVERQPNEPQGYNLLSAAFMQKARETGDFSLNDRADSALKQSLALNAGNYDAIKLQAKLLLTYHRFGEALEVAKRAQAMSPKDHDVYGALTDALVELGDYQAAVESAQKMVDLRPDTASYSRVSYLRFLHGDTQGAIAAMRLASEAASPADPESMAWCRIQLGKELVNAGQLKDAEREFDRALFVFPDYHAALAAKGFARLLARDLLQAAQYYERAQQRVPQVDYAVALGDLYTKLGREIDAKRQYELVDFIERSGSVQGTYSRQLALFWADRNQRLDEALAIALNERRVRRDIYTCDVLAWCLYKNGRLDEAKVAIDEGLRLGTRDPLLLYHAGMIANGRGDRAQAKTYLQQALEINPTFDILAADTAKQTLESIR